MAKITGKEMISAIIDKFPQTEKIINKYFQSACVHCPMAVAESIEEGAKAHGVSLEQILTELNNVVFEQPSAETKKQEA